MPRFMSAILLIMLALTVPSAPARAQTTSDGCEALKRTYDEALRTADSVLRQLVEKAVNSGASQVFQQLGIAPNLSPEQAINKGAVAAMSPPAQAAVLIYLLRANTTMQEMVWKGCKP
jgi:hypothetical protein